jgi:hypothetical protein
MTAPPTFSARPPSLTVLADDAVPPRSRERRTALFGRRWLTASVAVISVRGDIDASNADALTQYTCGYAVQCRGLILDLRGLEFCGTDGFCALHRISVCCARAATGWAMVPGPAVFHMLAICDPHASLPAVGSVDAALATVEDQLHRPRPVIANRCGFG